MRSCTLICCHGYCRATLPQVPCPFDSTVSDSRIVTRDSEGSSLPQPDCRPRLHLEYRKAEVKNGASLEIHLTSPHIAQMRKPASSELCGPYCRNLFRVLWWSLAPSLCVGLDSHLLLQTSVFVGLVGSRGCFCSLLVCRQ